jgi:putative thioredoxin
MTRPDPRLSAALAGAVDLSALASRSQPAQQAGNGAAASGSAGGPAGANVIEATEANFQTEVLERSLSVPVVIDFWAEWCQPCKQLSPVLEKLAGEGNGSWVLAKVDVDANQRLAAAFRVQSIPTVYAVIGGQPVDGFSGALPEAQVRQFVAAVVKAGGQAAGQDEQDAAEEPPLDPRIAAADDKLNAGDLPGAEAAYAAVLAESPNDQDAKAGLAQVKLFRRLEGVDERGALAAAEAAPDDVDAQIAAADVDMLNGQAEQAYQRMIATVGRTNGEDRNRAREHLLELFALASPDDPLVARARRELASVLF